MKAEVIPYPYLLDLLLDLSSGLRRNRVCSSLYVSPFKCLTVTWGKPICLVHVSMILPTLYL